jgi:hypothetical protein
VSVDEPSPVAQVLTDLGITDFELDDDERVSEMLIIAKITKLSDGQVSLLIRSNDLDWIAQAGLISAAHQVELVKKPYGPGVEDD